MKAIVQDKYGSSRVLELMDIDKPEVGEDDVLVRVNAAGVHIGDWHVMTGQPYLMRIMGFGFSAPKLVFGVWMSRGRSRRLART
jgi:NADPH:quinone reductase-like Zn-dependent oxidoreductase